MGDDEQAQGTLTDWSLRDSISSMQAAMNNIVVLVQGNLTEEQGRITEDAATAAQFATIAAGIAMAAALLTLLGQLVLLSRTKPAVTASDGSGEGGGGGGGSGGGGFSRHTIAAFVAGLLAGSTRVGSPAVARQVSNIRPHHALAYEARAANGPRFPPASSVARLSGTKRPALLA
mmetsp:Transcript_59246/g.117688  ORF Transcript_59246/g.117688 Transcript_59246/m.117688 type:complete len:175 (-) Transcript_59246:278-802(-)|eukprot:CAMPEP_0174703570 /NCGR_PEP_ID=MMETSP1094-20130205/7472_1 /TAXON_ID=156173 /ORGANISM="Chrysochromulina brevifilum, Strain UTEX LB 985" /LENGTH=174 /DNA_ID=CAMNT_0015901511 /DNA_START=41 /DNA_END=565 /DNA_ORIENTATION=+